MHISTKVLGLTLAVACAPVVLTSCTHTHRRHVERAEEAAVRAGDAADRAEAAASSAEAASSRADVAAERAERLFERSIMK